MSGIYKKEDWKDFKSGIIEECYKSAGWIKLQMKKYYKQYKKTIN